MIETGHLVLVFARDILKLVSDTLFFKTMIFMSCHVTVTNFILLHIVNSNAYLFEKSHTQQLFKKKNYCVRRLCLLTLIFRGKIYLPIKLLFYQSKYFFYFLDSNQYKYQVGTVIICESQQQLVFFLRKSEIILSHRLI